MTAVLVVWFVLVLLVVGSALWYSLQTARGREEAALARVDPFDVLEMEQRLAAAAGRIRRVESDATMMARAHHLRAALWAYDSLLREACDLFGADQVLDGAAGAVEVTSLQRALSAQDLPDQVAASSTQVLGDADVRLRRELELGARGWSW